MNFDIKQIIATVAPALATALGGPLAGMATRAIATELLGDPDADIVLVESAVATASGPDLVKLKELDVRFKADMQKARIDLEEIAAKDRNSARDRQVRMKDWTPSVLGLAIIVGFFGVLGVIFAFGLPDTGAEVLFDHGWRIGCDDHTGWQFLLWFIHRIKGQRHDYRRAEKWWRMRLRLDFRLLFGLTLLAIASCSGLSSPVQAQANINCASRQIIVERLERRFNETVQVIGLGVDNQLFEIFASSESGTWSIVVTAPTGRACLVASGNAFETIITPSEIVGDGL